jgi:catechol 2,3-dioxygenase-like lactoylglutathione lyase family enzyme
MDIRQAAEDKKEAHWRLERSRMPKLNAVLETALYVDDLARAKEFYEEGLGLPLLLSNQRMCAFDVGGQSVLLLFRRGGSNEHMPTPGGTIPPHDGQGPLHIGFAISADELAAWEDRLLERGIAVESRITWSRGGTSLYFRDPDGHLLELLTPGLWATY